jgi:hypothetical protein
MKTISTQTRTASGERITATIEGRRVVIEQDGIYAGEGEWNGSQIVDCAARLGAADGSETEGAYEDLDAGLRAEIAAAS